MSHERTQSRSSQYANDSSRDDEDLVPGRVSLSSQLQRPARAIVSGLVARKARDANGVADGADHAVAAASSSGGSPLPEQLMRKFESSLGADLSSVRIHTGETSAAANDAVGARAYTLGNDIHFGAGQYDPHSATGEHLLAHEVAHTVQQGSGAQRVQFKLDVSSPGDALEHEADRAADAMVSGAQASVSFGSGVQRKIMRDAAAVPKTVADAKPDIHLPDLKVTLAKGKLGPFDVEASITGGVSLTQSGPASEAKKDDGKGIKTNVGVSKDGVQVDAEKEFGPDSWSWKPNLHGSAGLDKNGKPHVGYGLGLKHEGFSFDNLDVGPFTLDFSAFEWNAGSEPEVAVVTAKVPITLTSKQQYKGYHVSGTITVAVSASPDLVEIGKWMAEQFGAALSSGLAGAAGAILAPFAIFAGGLYGWSQAGKEFNELSHTVDDFHTKVQLTAKEALTGKHVSVPMLGKDLNASTSAAAASVRSAICKDLKIPEGALATIAKTRPDVPTKIYQMAWKQMWPGVRAHLMDLYKDTTWKDYTQERLFIEGYDKGSYSES